MAFLRYIIEATLHGKQDRIKAYTIAVEVLRRDIKFDPQLDPIVRVEATRLRRAIERYYASTGADDPIIIDLPRGSYIPTFRRREIPVSHPVRIPRKLNRLGGIFSARPFLAGAGAFALVVAVAAAAVVLWQAKRPTTSIYEQRAGNGLPVVLMEPFSVAGAPGPGTVSAAALQEKMRDALSALKLYNVVSARRSLPDPSPRRMPIIVSSASSIICRKARRRSRFDSWTRKDGADVWSKTFERIESRQDANASEEAIVLATSATLLQPFGVIHAHERAKHLATGDGDPRYRCVLEASESLRSFDPDQHLRAQACLERLTMEAPSFGFGLGFRYLAVIYLRGYQFGVGSRPGGGPTLDQALQAARRAIELQPESSRGYNALASVYLASGDVERAFAASDRAVSLNIYDMGVLGDYGGRMISAGDVDRGIALLRHAAGSAAVRPAAHHFYLFLGHYLKGEWANAAYQASQLTSNTNPFALDRARADCGTNWRSRKSSPDVGPPDCHAAGLARQRARTAGKTHPHTGHSRSIDRRSHRRGSKCYTRRCRSHRHHPVAAWQWHADDLYRAIPSDRHTDVKERDGNLAVREDQ